MNRAFPCPVFGNKNIKLSSMQRGFTRWYFLRCPECKVKMHSLCKEKTYKKWNNRINYINNEESKCNPEK